MDLDVSKSLILWYSAPIASAATPPSILVMRSLVHVSVDTTRSGSLSKVELCSVNQVFDDARGF